MAQFHDDDFPQPESKANDTVRVLSVVMCALTIVVATAILCIVAVVGIVQADWISRHGGHGGTLTTLCFFSCVANIAGAIMLIARFRPGLWIYLVGQAMFLYVFANWLVWGANHELEEAWNFLVRGMIFITLAGSVLQVVFARVRT